MTKQQKTDCSDTKAWEVEDWSKTTSYNHGRMDGPSWNWKAPTWRRSVSQQRVWISDWPWVWISLKFRIGIFNQFLGYIIGRRNVKTDATRKLDHGKLNQILPLKELPPPNHEGRSSKRPKLWKFNENSRSVWDSFRPVWLILYESYTRTLCDIVYDPFILAKSQFYQT